MGELFEVLSQCFEGKMPDTKTLLLAQDEYVALTRSTSKLRKGEICQADGCRSIAVTTVNLCESCSRDAGMRGKLPQLNRIIDLLEKIHGLLDRPQ